MKETKRDSGHSRRCFRLFTLVIKFPSLNHSGQSMTVPFTLFFLLSLRSLSFFIFSMFLFRLEREKEREMFITTGNSIKRPFLRSHSFHLLSSESSIQSFSIAILLSLSNSRRWNLFSRSKSFKQFLLFFFSSLSLSLLNFFSSSFPFPFV